MKYWDDDKLLSEYELITNYVKRLIQEKKKEQLKSARKYKKQLQIELELRGLI